MLLILSLQGCLEDEKKVHMKVLCELSSLFNVKDGKLL